MADASKYIGIAIFLIGVFMLAGGSLPSFSLFEISNPYTGGWTIGNDQPDFKPAFAPKNLDVFPSNILKQNIKEDDGNAQGILGIYGFNNTFVTIYGGRAVKYNNFIHKQCFSPDDKETDCTNTKMFTNPYYSPSFSDPRSGGEKLPFTVVTKEPINNKNMRFIFSPSPTQINGLVDIGTSNHDASKKYCNFGTSNNEANSRLGYVMMETDFNRTDTSHFLAGFGFNKEEAQQISCNIKTSSDVYAYATIWGVDKAEFSGNILEIPLQQVQQVTKEVIVYNNTGSQVQQVDLTDKDIGSKQSNKFLGILLLIIGIALLFV